jgi:hypothetical protein
VPIASIVKVVLTIIVYLCLTAALAVVSLFTRRPEPGDGFDDDL